MADFDREALSLSELKKMHKDVAKAISTYQDRQKAEARAKVDAIAQASSPCSPGIAYARASQAAPR